ncbi:hypothetical protein HK097_004867 [Rhizophlyctis rosea]|uniref:Histone H1 n=1 Tax=Rhizophlyctis rosea TaxID=64517 RepID=A0AAD5X645_9FUNG|nr:hypothetical protein HK097_004867 [Rhizophlyctis rosea]
MSTTNLSSKKQKETYPWSSQIRPLPTVTERRAATFRSSFAFIPTIDAPRLKKFLSRYPVVTLKDVIVFDAGTVFVWVGPPHVIYNYFRTFTHVEYLAAGSEEAIKKAFYKEQDAMSSDEQYALDEIELAYEDFITGDVVSDGDDSTIEQRQSHLFSASSSSSSTTPSKPPKKSTQPSKRNEALKSAADAPSSTPKLHNHKQTLQTMSDATSSKKTDQIALSAEGATGPVKNQLTVTEMVVAAITALKEPVGSSRQAIKAYVYANYELAKTTASASQINQAIREGVVSGEFVLPKGPSGRVQLARDAPQPKQKKPIAKKASTTTVKHPEAEPAEPKEKNSVADHVKPAKKHKAEPAQPKEKKTITKKASTTSSAAKKTPSSSSSSASSSKTKTATKKKTTAVQKLRHRISHAKKNAAIKKVGTIVGKKLVERKKVCVDGSMEGAKVLMTRTFARAAGGGGNVFPVLRRKLRMRLSN